MEYKTTVAIVRTADYEGLDAAVAEALSLIGADRYIAPDDTVLFKPNLLMRIRNACTEADFLAAVARFIRPLNANLKAGDSPGQFRHRAASVMRGVGMDAVLEAEKIAYAEFESGGVLVENPKARHMKRFHIAKPVVEADCIVNLCRPKSHIEAAYTGAVKNYWGIIPGGEKARCHLHGRNPAEFGHVLADNYEAFLAQGKKRIVVMDARKLMEGPGGPANGFMRPVGLVLAGYDEAAVDMVMLAIGRIDGVRAVPHLAACRERGLGVTDMDEIEIKGLSIETVQLKRKAGITSTTTASLLNNFIARTVIYKYMRRMPVLKKKETCVMCGDCFNICPNRAIVWEKQQTPVFEKEKCVSCLCCVECCPQQALEASPAGLSGFFLKYPEITPPHPEQTT
ncbi:DUF362 domain-containing protein [Desulfosudis oleivorans]|uniref:4Fe-4S ferredoxin-type domain-containing protein n=1 Tax=Desulfosudis oleivorans (strain DSM 6200 / JCM 39069 / Hxd3) TaxID=96561 RepID=A8ZYA7_DESOH|nr:DUF362 domain-containing protein [Desulfosudis oleivorans]ABW67114.1 protein of unknown function DUF362 [Desulfosudis oleivorans Hxd3]